MTTTLTFAGYSFTGFWSVASQELERPAVEEVTYFNTFGRLVINLGSSSDGASRIVFSGDGTRLVSGSRSGLSSMVVSLRSLLQSQTVGSLSYYSGDELVTEVSMRLASVVLSGGMERKLPGTVFHQRLALEFKKAV